MLVSDQRIKSVGNYRLLLLLSIRSPASDSSSDTQTNSLTPEIAIKSNAQVSL